MNPMPNPLPVGNDALFVTGGYRAGSVLLQLKSEKGIFSANPVFINREYGAQIAYPILHAGHLYMMCSSNFKRAGIVMHGSQWRRAVGNWTRERAGSRSYATGRWVADCCRRC